MKRKTIGFAIGANAAPTGATCSTTASVGPSRAVTASGSASVTQNTMTSATTAASRCASGVNPSSGSGQHQDEGERAQPAPHLPPAGVEAGLRAARGLPAALDSPVMKTGFRSDAPRAARRRGRYDVGRGVICCPVRKVPR